jgi:trehalose-phosphatase
MSCAPQQPINADSFFSEVTDAHSRLLLLDYDGTLAPFHNNRYRAFPYDGIAELLDIIMRLERGRVVLVSGRRAAEIPPLLGLSRAPEIWGSHGLERLLPEGICKLQPMDDLSYETHAQVTERLVEEGLSERIEVKPGSIAVHWRGLPAQSAQEIESRVQCVGTALQLAPTALVPFDGGIEIRLSLFNKGHAVQHLISESQEPTAIAYLGDDLTDEDAFHVLKGKGLSVLVRPEYRTTAADLWLRPPEELVGFLRMWITACGGTA